MFSHVSYIKIHSIPKCHCQNREKTQNNKENLLCHTFYSKLFLAVLLLLFSHVVRRSALHIAIIPSADAIRMHTINSKTFILSIPLQIDCVQALVFVELIVIIFIVFIRWVVIRTIVFVWAEKAVACFRIYPCQPASLHRLHRIKNHNLPPRGQTAL